MTKVRTTFNPGLVLEVDDTELVDLERQGLLHSREHGTSPLPEGLAPWRGSDETADDLDGRVEEPVGAIATTTSKTTKQKGAAE